MRALVSCLRRGLRTHDDAYEAMDLVAKALHVGGIVLGDEDAFAGWNVHTGLPESWPDIYLAHREQDPAVPALMAAPLGTWFQVTRDYAAADRATELYRGSREVEIADGLLTRLPRPGVGDTIFVLYRYDGMPAFDDDDRLIAALLYPHLAGAFGRRAVAAQGVGDPITVRVEAPGTVHLGRVAKTRLAEALPIDGDAGWARLERMIRNAALRYHAPSQAARPLRLVGHLVIEFVHTRPGPGPAWSMLGLISEDTTHLGRARSPAEHALSLRQRQVARLAARGATVSEIADALHIRAPTVRTHLKNVYLRLGVNSRGELASLLES